ncbi:MAG TPA: DUF3048 domain-containing protein [Actinomycetes bacterium]|nr:DUF3048 domain-containing protein [Actinomycetes bacterium]
MDFVIQTRTLVALTAVVAVAACSGDGKSPGASTTSAPASAAVQPLTGEAAADGLPNRPVLVVKVDNSSGARPQVGLSAADLVVEELVEGGLTRLAVMYYSALPSAVTPVRSVRTTDIAIAAPTGGVLVASGGAGRVLATIHDAGLTVVTEGDRGFSRDRSRRAPYDVVVDPTELMAEVTELRPPTQPYLPWASDEAELPPGASASSVTVRFSAAHTTRWDWTGARWRRVDDPAAEGDRFTPDNLLVLRVAIRDAGYKDPAGNPVPETDLTGSGDAILLTKGRSIEARWSKPGAGRPLAFTDPAGTSLRIPPGRTWIELVPKTGDVTVR